MPTERPQRALIVVRLSRVTDATTSPERQREACERLCRERGWTVAGVAEDLDVSGSIDPLEREGIGPWLRDRLPEFDVIVSSKLDRLGRNARQILNLAYSLKDHGKSLVTGDLGIDIVSTVGQMILFVLATAAQLEWEAISERNTNAAQFNIREGRYRGGVVPAGYRKVKRNGTGWELEPDDGEDGLAPVIRSIVARLLSGERISRIVRDLNDRGVPTAKDRQAVLNGREPKGTEWSVSNLTRILQSPSLIGQVTVRPSEVVNGKKVYGEEQVLYGDDGMPVVRAEPLISEADYRSVQRIFAERKEETPKLKRAEQPTLLLQVLFCGCGKPMWRLKGGATRKVKLADGTIKTVDRNQVHRYRCASYTRVGKGCGNASVPIPEIDGEFTQLLLGLLGDRPHVVKVFQPGTDHTTELAEIDARLESLSEAVTRFPAGSPALNNLLTQVDTLSARRVELASLPVKSAGYRYEPTGQTFREFWESLDITERNDWLRANDIQVIYTKRTGRGKQPRKLDFVLGDVPALYAATNVDAAEGLDQYGDSFRFGLMTALTDQFEGKEGVEVQRP
jgi:site-specific DNA recombinase